jgi:ribosomal protein L37E
MSILFICHRCGEKTEFENKKDMHCNCGYYANDSKDIGKTWSGTTKVEFDTISIDESVERMNK